MAGSTFTLRGADGTEYRIVAGQEDSGIARVTVNDTALRVESLGGAAMRIEPVTTGDESGAPGTGITAHAISDGDTLWVFLDGRVFTFEAERAGRRRRTGTIAGSLTAPMPATVRRIEVTPGQAVRRGDILIVLEAMKMELPVRAPADGTIARVNCREGELVPAGHELVELQP